MKSQTGTPNLFSRVLVALDLTDISRPLLLWALGLAQRFHSDLYLAHVIPDDRDSDSRSQAERRLRGLFNSVNQTANS
jgi:nucleotide-binding universal stress UspA family protein